MSASTSLPAPFGPVISTGTSACATCVAMATSVCIASLSYTMPRRSKRSASCLARLAALWSRSRCASARALRSSSRLRTVVSSRASSQGLAM